MYAQPMTQSLSIEARQVRLEACTQIGVVFHVYGRQSAWEVAFVMPPLAILLHCVRTARSACCWEIVQFSLYTGCSIQGRASVLLQVLCQLESGLFDQGHASWLIGQQRLLALYTAKSL